MATDLIEFHLAPQTFDPAIPLEEIHEHPENYNQGADEALAGSLDAHGFFGTILVQRSTGAIVAGNSRYRTSKAKGATHLPGFWLDIDDDEARRILAQDNVIPKLSVFDEAKLVALLQRVKDSSGTVWGTGYDEAALASLVRHQAAVTATPDEIDDWESMPDFDQPGNPAAYRTTIHFPTDEAADLFFRLLGHPKAVFMWWPSDDGARGLDYSKMEVMQQVAAEMVRTRPIEFPCPTCGSVPGEQCRTKAGEGHQTGAIHTARRELAESSRPAE